ERKSEECSHAEKGECHEIIPCDFLIQIQDRKCDEDDDRDNLLNDLELKSRELDIAETIRGDRQAVFEQCNAPRDQDRSPERPVVPVFQVPVPGESHEDIRKVSSRMVLIGSDSAIAYRVSAASRSIGCQMPPTRPRQETGTP